MKIALTSISVNDPLAAFKFYTEVLGFKEKMYLPEMFLAIVVSPEECKGVSRWFAAPSNRAFRSAPDPARTKTTCLILNTQKRIFTTKTPKNTKRSPAPKVSHYKESITPKNDRASALH